MAQDQSEACPGCGITYGRFRTGMTYQSVYETLWSGSDDPETWIYKRRHTILGKWHQLKKEMWEYHLQVCGADPGWSNKQEHNNDVPF